MAGGLAQVSDDSSDLSSGSSEVLELGEARLHIRAVKKATEVVLALYGGALTFCPELAAQTGSHPPAVAQDRSPNPPLDHGALAQSPGDSTPTSPVRPITSGPADDGPPKVRPLTLSAAIAQALKTQPTMRQAKAQTSAAEGRVEQARAGYLPQVTGTAAYQRTTGNFVVRPGSVPSNVSVATSYTLNPTYNYYTASLSASQLIYDFGQTSERWSAASSAVSASAASEEAIRLQTIMNVQSAFFQAWAQHALVGVAQETLADQVRHLEQVDASVKVGVQPEIALATARASVANAKLQVIAAQNAYEIAKDQLNAAIGVMRDTNYEVADEEAPQIDAEDGPVEPLVTRALESRPDITALERQRDAQTKTIRSLRGAYGPSLVASANGTEAGIHLSNMVPNWNIGVTLTWPILQGGLTNGQIREAEANLEVIDAQLASLRLQIRTQVDQARLAVRAAKSSIGAADEALANARLQLKLAEGRYSAGVGSIIELTDAQVAYTSARAQVVQAHFSLSNSRAQLVIALGIR